MDLNENEIAWAGDRRHLYHTEKGLRNGAGPSRPDCAAGTGPGYGCQVNAADYADEAVQAAAQPHTISALLSRMEVQGLVKKERNLERGNWVRVTLTKRAKEAYERQVGARRVRNITECLSKQELDVLNKINRKLRAKGIELLREMLPSPYGEPFW